MSHSHFISGQWVEGSGQEFTCKDPYGGSVTWRGRAASDAEVGAGVSAARDALADWVATPLESRIAAVRDYGELLVESRDVIAHAISHDTGKPLWESRAEAGAMAKKIELSIRAYGERRHPDTRSLDGGTAATRFRPHGVCAVLGPFNLPGHLPNGHIVPALLAGNSIVFKPSEEAAAVGQLITELWAQATNGTVGIRVWNLIQGGASTGVALSQHRGIDGLFFTGSSATGLKLSRAFADTPWRILALEMGGNNPLIVWGLESNEQRAAAVIATIQSAYITAGQRCTCARRLILSDDQVGGDFLDVLVNSIDGIRIGGHNSNPEPFMGPVINSAAAQRIIDAQAALCERGGQVLRKVERKEGSEALLTPGLIDVTDVADRSDEEYFGPLLQVIRVKDFDAAIEEANQTEYGLAAALLSPRRDLYDRFYRSTHAGVINWNSPTTGARGDQPFGGVGASGNHRPSGYYAADYCSFPVASIEHEALVPPSTAPTGLTR